jgi:catechol 2,3-dioxygenase-like lactoylglutathione lyase family enzyme
MLGTAQLTAFVPTTDGERAQRFYVDILGLAFVSDDPFALVLDANGIKVRVSKVGGFTPQKFTVLGWEVSNIEKAVTELVEKGVSFDNYGFPGQDERGIWTAPGGGAKVAWFKDPDRNVLSITEGA